MPLRLGTHQESPQPRLGRVLVKAVQVENIVESDLACGDLAQGAPVERNRRRGLAYCRGGG